MTLTNAQRRELAKQRLTMVVSPFEAELIKEIRKYTHGRITVHLLEGIPYRYELGISHMLFSDDNGISKSSARKKD